MRSVTPEESRWPRRMTITVTDDSESVMELLWVREAWGLHPAGDLPPLLVEPPTEVREAPDAVAWENAWSAMWDAVIRHAGGTIDPAGLQELITTPAGSPVRAELIAQLVGPTWRDRFGDAAFDDRHHAWTERLFQARAAARPRSLDEEPERRALDALVPAWRAGLTKVVTIPCRGEYTRVIGDCALLVTDTTRADPVLYSAALASFR